MARKRPTASDMTPPALTCIDGGRQDSAPLKLTRAQSEALRLSAPLTHLRLQAHLRPQAAPYRRPPRPPGAPLRGL